MDSSPVTLEQQEERLLLDSGVWTFLYSSSVPTGLVRGLEWTVGGSSGLVHSVHVSGSPEWTPVSVTVWEVQRSRSHTRAVKVTCFTSGSPTPGSKHTV